MDENLNRGVQNDTPAKKGIGGMIFAVMLLAGVFVLFHLVIGGFENRLINIDGEFYSAGSRDVTVYAFSDEGIKNISSFERLENLTLRPARYQALKNVYAEAEKGTIPADSASLAVQIKSIENEYTGCTYVRDISFLSGLDKLKSLDIRGCLVSDLSPLKGLASLEKLDITDTSVTDLSPLYDMPSLKAVKLGSITEEDRKRLEERGISVFTEDDA
ncbi:MAG: hypothetical protein J6F31_07495 [Oscillospiraceae bacterium]|nr:hypothetical protein [Oscillospiraceae bacterium]